MKLKKSRRDRSESVSEVPDGAGAAMAAVAAAPPRQHYFGPVEPTLSLECWEHELSQAQLDAFHRAEKEHRTIKDKLAAIVKECGGEVVFNGDQCEAYSVCGSIPELDELSAASTTSTVRPYGKKKAKKDKESEAAAPAPEEAKNKEGKKLKKDKGSKVPAASPIPTIPSGVRPSEAQAIGGLATGSNKSPVVDLTKDENKNAPDSREVSFNKLQGKTYPSLVVVARPYLRAKDANNSDRPGLDAKVKSVLMHTPTKFTEWLIQQGLIRSEQTCVGHPATKLKLGMYSDTTKFPYSGGYVWISECCPSRFVSVFFGSLFEGSIHPPSVLLKLIYHWACQTNVQNVVQWVKVDNLYVKSLFAWLRAACTAALHHHTSTIGGPGKRIQVGVISLGTTSHDGAQRQVKVEVLGVLDNEAKLIRLRAVEPLADGERNYKKRFQKILEPLAQWVSPDSTILTDLTVDKGTLVQMGFKTVHQVSNADASCKNGNSHVMEYLRRIVPRMFQNTLSLLSRQIIQQFLDELVWREWYGTTACQAFDNIVAHLAEQTRVDAKDNLVVRLNKIQANPFKNWRYATPKYSKIVQPPVVEIPKESSKKGRKKKEASPPPPPPPPPPAPRPATPTTQKQRGRKRKNIDYSSMAGEAEEDNSSEADGKKDKKLRKQKDDDDAYDVKKDLKKKPDKKKEEKAKLAKKKGTELKMTIKKEQKEDQMVDLDTYYFGQMDGEYNVAGTQMSVQCTECTEEFDECTKLQIHLLSHEFPLQSEGDHLCQYCLGSYSSEAIDNHLIVNHPTEVKSNEINTYACLICDIRVSTVSLLASHLQKTHTQLELPYLCGICGFKVSSHRLCVDHFYKDHKNSATLQCPFCLKVVKIFADGCELKGNVEFFVQHLRDHKNEAPSKCSKCSLRFIHLGTMKDHQIKNHLTVFDAIPINHQGISIHKPKNKATPPIKDTTNHIFVDIFETTSLYIPDGLLCKECDTQLEDDRHFLGTYKCTRCIYQTSCWKSLLDHSSKCQIIKTKANESAPLSAAIHCICSFSCNDGNAMAQHLAQCERKTAYASEESAKANTIAVCPTKQSMMDSLCLQRKDADYTPLPPQTESLNDYPAPPSVNTTLSLDDLAPPSVLQNDQMEIEQLKNEVYEQPLATPQVQHHDMQEMQDNEMMRRPPETEPNRMDSEAMSTSRGLDSYMDSTGEFEPLPAEPMPQPEFEPL